MRYVVYGVGAIGGVVAGNLDRAGVSVSLVARGAHLAAIRDQGLILDRADGRHTVRAPASDSAAHVDWTPETAVLLCVKSHQTSDALADIVAHAPPGTPVVSLQNGVANERMLLRQVAAAYAVCVMLPATHLEPGLVVQKCHPVPGILDLGRAAGGTDATGDAISADLRTAGFESVPRSDVMAWKHRKLLMNLGNGVDAACMPGAAASELTEWARAEGEAIIAAAGIACVTEAEDRERRGDLLRRRDDLSPSQAGGSTWQSLTRGGATEVDYLSGEVVLLGRLAGVPAPVNELVQRTVTDLARTGGPARSADAAELLARLP